MLFTPDDFNGDSVTAAMANQKVAQLCYNLFDENDFLGKLTKADREHFSNFCNVRICEKLFFHPFSPEEFIARNGLVRKCEG